MDNAQHYDRQTYAFSSNEEGSGALLRGPAMVEYVCGGGGGVARVRLGYGVGQKGKTTLADIEDQIEAITNSRFAV